MNQASRKIVTMGLMSPVAACLALLVGLLGGCQNAPERTISERRPSSPAPADTKPPKPGFSKWGISLNPPQGWNRWSADKERAGIEMLAGQMGGTGRALVHLAVWSKPDESAAMMLGVSRETSGSSPQLSRLLQDERGKMNAAEQAGDVTKINRLEIAQAAGRKCVVSDVTRSNGGRGVCYYFVSTKDIVCLMWIVQNASEFAQHQAALNSVLASLSITRSK